MDFTFPQNDQEIFDVVASSLYRQGTYSQDEATQTCLYRGPNGTKCALGFLIPDEAYMKSFEAKEVRRLIEFLKERKRPSKIQKELLSFLENNDFLLRELQTVHDEIAGQFINDPKKFRKALTEGLKSAASRNGLKFNGRKMKRDAETV